MLRKAVESDIQTWVEIMLVLSGDQVKPQWDLQPGIILEPISVPHFFGIIHNYKALRHLKVIFLYIIGIKVA